ncbi:MAG TPA: efflux RND transporter permease subunit, partial [Rhodothermales bacterium]|nr:efflux RND transporter permease subunit [Rhodothermales bacterium]
MYISDFAIKRPMVTVVVMVALIIFGFFALQKLLVDEYPDVQQPVLLIGIPYPGASPSGVEREVLDPVEEAISGISGVDKVFGTAADSYAQITVLFLFGKDMNVASQEIRDKISAIRADLPPEMKEPIIDHLDPSDLPIVSITVTSNTLSPVTLTRLADKQIGRALRAIPGVARVTLSGDTERELTVEVKPDAMASTGISVADVVAALEAQNLAVPVGRLNGTTQEQTIRLEGRLKDPRAFEDIVIGTGVGGRPVRLGEVATVTDGSEEQRSLALFNEKGAIGIDVVKMRSASTTKVSDEIHATLEQLETSLPQDVDVRVIRDAGERVSASVWNVQEALMEGALLTVLVVFLFLNSWRSTVITGLALPVSVIASFIAVWAVGFTLNVMSLLGLSLAIGILIDDAIVVRENIVRHVHMGKSHMRAAHEGTSEIGMAVAATTFSIIAVFVPVAFMPGVAGQWFKPFALTIACSVLVSLFVSFSLDPMLSAYWPDPHVEEKDKGFITRLLDRFNDRFNQLAGLYRRVIGWSLDHPAIVNVWVFASFLSALALASTGFVAALLIFAVAGITTFFLRLLPSRWYATVPVILVGVIAMGVMLGAAPKSKSVGSSFFGTDDRSEVNLTFLTPPGSSLSYTRGKLDDVLDIIRSHPEVRYTYATIGNATGGVDEGAIYVRLVKPGEREMGADEFAQQLRGELEQVKGLTPSLSTSGFGGQKQIQIQLRGDDLAALQRGADMVLAEVQQVEGAVDVDLDTRGQRPEWKIDIDRDHAAAKGITAGQIALALRPAFAGLDVGDWVDPDGETR